MPYREQPGLIELCTYCGDVAAFSCRLCRRRLCQRHALVTVFYVPAAECVPTALGGECAKARGALRRQLHRSRALVRRLTGTLPGMRKADDP